MKNNLKDKGKTYSEKINMYQTWIIDQISSDNHKIIDAAQHGSLFDQKIKTTFLDVAFKNLEEQNIIERDTVTGNYFLVSKRSETEEKETKLNYYISYPGVIENDTIQCATKKFKTLEEALTFVKTHNLMNYYIQRSPVTI